MPVAGLRTAGGAARHRPGVLSGLPLLELGVVVLALLVRVTVVVTTPGYHPLFDAGDYSRIGSSVAAGHGFPGSVLTALPGPSAFRPPLYPYLLGAIYLVFGSSTGVLVARLVNAILATVVVVLVWLIARRLWGGAAGRISLVIAAVFPPLIAISAALLTEPLFVALELGALAAAIEGQRRRSARWFALCGALCGLATLTRPTGALLVFAGVLAVWSIRPRRRSEFLIMVAALVGAMVLVVAPWSIRNISKFHQFVAVSTDTGYTVAGNLSDVARRYPGYTGTWIRPQQTQLYGPLFHDRALDEASLDARLRSRALSYAGQHPGYVAELGALNVLRTYGVLASSPRGTRGANMEADTTSGWSPWLNWSSLLVLLAAAVGVGGLLSGRLQRGGTAFLWVVPPLMIISAAPAGGSQRYGAPVYPFLIWLAAIAAVIAASASTGRAHAVD